MLALGLDDSDWLTDGLDDSDGLPDGLDDSDWLPDTDWLPVTVRLGDCV